jgi:hypothetical protein
VKSVVKEDMETKHSTAKKVWRIFHFEQRFEMDKRYQRQGGLDYVRMFVTSTTQAKSNESTGFIQQLSELEHYFRDDRDALEGRFWRLCRLTATQEDWLRGYLLDSDQKPLTAARLAARLHLKLDDIKKTLCALKKVGLIEYVDLPVLVEPKRNKNDDNQDDKEDDKKEKEKGKVREKGRKPAQKAACGGDLQTFANVSESFINRHKIELNQKETNRQSTEENKQTKAEANAEEKPRAENKAEGCEQEKVTRTEGQEHTDTKPNEPNVPIEPQVVDAGECKVILFPNAPPLSLSDAQAKVERKYLKDALNRNRMRMGVGMSGCEHTSESLAYGELIYTNMQLPWSRDSKEAARQIGCFSSCYLHALASGLSPPLLDELLQGCTREATRLGRVYKSNKKAAAKTWVKKVFQPKLVSRIPASG